MLGLVLYCDGQTRLSTFISGLASAGVRWRALALVSQREPGAWQVRAACDSSDAGSVPDTRAEGTTSRRENAYQLLKPADICKLELH